VSFFYLTTFVIDNLIFFKIRIGSFLWIFKFQKLMKTYIQPMKQSERFRDASINQRMASNISYRIVIPVGIL
jgi:hypothetical protein